jgi:hypothetical protein
VTLSTYLDKNANGLGEPWELTSQYNLCSLKGETGKDGLSVVFEKMEAVTCGNGGTSIFFASDSNYNGLFDVDDLGMQQITICNGLNGQNAEFSSVEVVNPCGDKEGIVDEVFLRLDKNTIVAYYEDGGNRRLSVLEENTLYATTDGDKACKFKIINGEIIKL